MRFDQLTLSKGIAFEPPELREILEIVSKDRLGYSGGVDRK